MSAMPALDPGRTAVVVIDMQNDFCHPDGYYASLRDVSGLIATVAPVARLIASARAAGAGIVYTRLVHDAAHGAMESRHRLTPARWSSTGDRLLPGTWGAEVHADLAPRPGDPVIDKAGYSAFEGTGMEAVLHERGIDTIILCGVTTYACVLATGFSAFDRGFDVVLATDATASWDEGLTRAAGGIVDYLLGRAVPMDAIAFAPAHSHAT